MLVLVLCLAPFASCTAKDGNTDIENNDGETVVNTKDPEDQEDPPEPADNKEDASLDSLRKQISNSGAVLGVAYLGYFHGTFDETKDYMKQLGLYDAYPFVETLELDDIIVNENNEMYLVVPADKTERIRVYCAIPNEETYELEKGELLGESSEGKPFLLLCNVSEIIPNVILETANLNYSPCLSGEDGELVENDAVYDFSPYGRIKEFFDIQNGLADGADPIFCGSWIGEAENGDAELMTMCLSLYVDKTANYVYGIGNSEPVEWFSGEWDYDAENDLILLDLFGGPPNDYLDSDALYIDPYDLECGFSWDMDYRDDGTYLVLTHRQGDPILYGKNGATFEFAMIEEEYEETYTYLIGSWGIISEKKETYLEIFDNGDAHYYVVCDGITEKDFYGTWYADDLTLSLSLYEHSENGEIIDEPAVFFGDYGISYDGEFLTLSLIAEATDPLTTFMEENGYDSFLLCGVS